MGCVGASCALENPAFSGCRRWKAEGKAAESLRQKDRTFVFCAQRCVSADSREHACVKENVFFAGRAFGVLSAFCFAEGEQIMLETITNANGFVNGIVWGPVGLALLLLLGTAWLVSTGEIPF